MSLANSIRTSEVGHSCGCIGPQNGEPLCPCRMRGVKVVDGRYVQIIDHGEVRRSPAHAPISAKQQGCVCPPTSEQTCQSPVCPRKGVKVSGAL